ncbi:mercury transporter [Flavobacterium akiainvivens]|uniref:Mercury transporter n=1 Tax=Flavobacterium akiainvivens TaxID=1202724 RepID=A0A0M8MFV6_9FLAO|nr:DUF3347 domain-containing protein [Flavobacterium akiainvivens]KOS05401.1 mercury transporter [Flavobacterium akiainvivens]SFQ73676.1 Protein of unknown function [Flavobacterium akiainvivens]
MNLFYKIVVPVFFIASLQANAQIKNAKTEILTVQGNCNMCKETIEKTATEKKVSEAAWDKDSHKLTLTYDSTKTTSDALLKKVAYAGYDNEKYLAPTEAYNKLPGCCQYDRQAEASAQTAMHESHMGKTQETPAETSILKEVYTSYFTLKDALVKSNGVAAATASAQLVKALKAVPMDKMEHSAHMVWMKNLPALQEGAEHIAETKDIKHQRDHFVTLSDALYTVAKAFEMDETVYYQHCPMYNNGKGANWLSLDKEVKNPYYGSKMLSCGSTTETLK